jgi:hypothetical protein
MPKRVLYRSISSILEVEGAAPRPPGSGDEAGGQHLRGISCKIERGRRDMSGGASSGFPIREIQTFGKIHHRPSHASGTTHENAFHAISHIISEGGYDKDELSIKKTRVLPARRNPARLRIVHE